MRERVPVSEIREIVSTVKTWNPSRSDKQELFDYIDLSSIDQQKKVVISTSKISPKEAPSRARQLVQKGDVLVSTVRPNLNGVAYVPGQLDGATASTGFCVLRPRQKSLDGRYLFHWVQTSHFVNEMVKLATGANYPAVSDRTVKTSKIPLPPLAEQKRIAAILDNADAIRRKRQAAIKLADDFLRATFLNMFGDPVTNPKGWKVNPLSSVCSNYDSKRIPLKMSDRAKRTGPYPYYGASGIIDYVDEHIFNGEYLLIGEDGANLVARSTPIAFIATGQFWVNNHAHVIGSNGKATLQFLENFFSFIDLKPFISGSAQPKLTRSKLDNIPVPLPPMDLQTKYMGIIKVLNSYDKKQKNMKQRAHNLFNSLTQRAFRGEL